MTSNAGSEAVDLAKAAGFVLDEWQQWCLEGACGERVDGSWAAFECGLILPRQNGKNGVLIARELAGIVLFGDDLIIHSAHRADTTLEHFRKMVELAESFDEFGKLIKRISHVNGHEGIELKGGRRVNFVSRARTPGRGFSGSMVVLDEAYDLSPQAIGAMIPTLATRKMAQVWYTSSAPHSDSVVLHGVRSRGRDGVNAERLFYAEWANDADTAIDSVDAIYGANPGMGIRISLDYVESERRLMSAIPAEYMRERLGVAEALVTDSNESPIPMAAWQAVNDPTSVVLDPVVFGVDASPDRQWASIVVAGHRVGGGTHVEVVDHRSGVPWLVARLGELRRAWPGSNIVVDPASPAWSIVAELEAGGVEVTKVSAQSLAAACGAFVDAVNDRSLHYRPDAEFSGAMSAAVHVARKRRVGDGWAWSRRDSRSDITPLVAATLAFGVLPAAVEWGPTFVGLGAVPDADDDEE